MAEYAATGLPPAYLPQNPEPDAALDDDSDDVIDTDTDANTNPEETP
jgi:hypothetical protein